MPNHVQVLPCNLHLIGVFHMLEAIYLVLLSTVLGKIASVVDAIESEYSPAWRVYSLYGAALLSLVASTFFAFPHIIG